nr:hypothetical protein [Tanacetum cinerariifolium]
MADLPVSPVPTSPDHAQALPKPTFPDYVLNFPDDDLAVEIEVEGDPEEDQGMDIDEGDPEEDHGMNFRDDDEPALPFTTRRLGSYKGEHIGLRLYRLGSRDLSRRLIGTSGILIRFRLYVVDRIMPPRRMNRNAIERLIVDLVATSILEHEANWANAVGDEVGGAGQLDPEVRALTWWNDHIHSVGTSHCLKKNATARRKVLPLPEVCTAIIVKEKPPSPVAESTPNHLQNSSPSASETGASDSILSKPAVKFVKAAERPTTDKVETVKNPAVRYVELYIKTTKRDRIGILSEDKKKQRNKKLKDSEAEHQGKCPDIVLYPGYKEPTPESFLRSRLHWSDKNKEGLGYTTVPPPIAQLYLSPKKDLSWTGLSECADDTVTDYSRPSPVAENKEIFMLVEKDYPLRKGLALVMICYKLQVENFSQMANDLVLKIYKIANSPRQQEGTSHCLKKNATARRKVLPLPEVCTAIIVKEKPPVKDDSFL